MKRTLLQTDHATVLQHINETGEEDFEYLAESLHFRPAHLANIVQDLHHRGLIITRHTYLGMWIRLSSRGKKLSATLWPEGAAM